MNSESVYFLLHKQNQKIRKQVEIKSKKKTKIRARDGPIYKRESWKAPRKNRNRHHFTNFLWFLRSVCVGVDKGKNW